MTQTDTVPSHSLGNGFEPPASTGYAASVTSSSTRRGGRRRKLRRQGSLKLLFTSDNEPLSEPVIDNDTQTGTENDAAGDIIKEEQKIVEEDLPSTPVVLRKSSDISLKSIFKNKSIIVVDDADVTENTIASNTTKKSVSFKEFDEEIGNDGSFILRLPSADTETNQDSTALSEDNCRGSGSKIEGNDASATDQQINLSRLNKIKSCSSIRDAVRLSIYRSEPQDITEKEVQSLDKLFFDPNDHSPDMRFLPLLTDDLLTNATSTEVDDIIEIDKQLRLLSGQMKLLKARKRELKRAKRKEWLGGFFYASGVPLSEAVPDEAGGQRNNVVRVSSWSLPWTQRQTTATANP